MPRWEADLRSIHQFSTRNRVLLAQSEFAGCFYCGTRFAPTEITEWIDLPAGDDSDDERLERGVTALCPYCGIDSVLPTAAPITWDNQLLKDMHAHWFEK